ncbi:hypothetical protein [Nostoc sp. C117]|uniref:hypothetical protein n=1 Tax=Nostoc sp. C117 TaxID=3349875 RepID=UPI00370D4D6C
MKDRDKNIRLLKGHTAFLFIHGIGEQNPFETVDLFTQNFLTYFDKENLSFKLEHVIAQRRLSTGSFWTESFIRLKSTDNDGDWLIDIHEYYWSAYTENKITVPEILRWAEQTLDGTIKFYNRKENQPLLDQLLAKKNRKSLFKYRLRSLTILLRIFNFFYPVLRMITWLILSLAGPFLQGRFLQSAWQLSKKIVTPPLVNFIGDITIYSITDAKSPYKIIRQQILTESLTLLKEILQDKQIDYDQVIIGGHSLGSCIAYDTLNLLCVEASLSPDKNQSLLLNKIKGLITFGSPLDKIAFFFREVAQEGQYIRQRILEHLNSFRVKPEFAQQSKYSFPNPVLCKLEGVRWINYYHLKDPISGHLDYYENLVNIEMKYPASWGDQGHQGYWSDANFYEDIADRFLYVTNQNEESQEIVQPDRHKP